MGARIRREYDAFVQKNANTVSHNSRFLQLWQMSWLACRLDVAHVFNAQHLSSSVRTRNETNVFGPNVVLIATSAASRPWAMSTRPMRGILLRASNVYHCPPRQASNQPAKWGVLREHAIRADEIRHA